MIEMACQIMSIDDTAMSPQPMRILVFSFESSLSEIRRAVRTWKTISRSSEMADLRF